MAMTGIDQSGFPLGIGGSYANDYTNGFGNSRVNQYRKIKVVHKSSKAYFGTDPSAMDFCGTNADGTAHDDGVCAYGQPGLSTFGNAPNYTERGTN